MVNRVRTSTPEVIENFEFKIGDMGLAKELNPLNNNLTSTFAGTPLYMAPEVVGGKNYDFKADVWSVGTLLFQLLTGSFPFKGNNLEQLKQNISLGCYSIPKDTKISLGCIDFLNKCLRINHAKRKYWDELLKHPFISD
jgi:serine/threonine protein kinase